MNSNQPPNNHTFHAFQSVAVFPHNHNLQTMVPQNSQPIYSQQPLQLHQYSYLKPEQSQLAQTTIYHQHLLQWNNNSAIPSAPLPDFFPIQPMNPFQNHFYPGLNNMNLNNSNNIAINNVISNEISPLYSTPSLHDQAKYFNRGNQIANAQLQYLSQETTPSLNLENYTYNFNQNNNAPFPSQLTQQNFTQPNIEMISNTIQSSPFTASIANLSYPAIGSQNFSDQTLNKELPIIIPVKKQPSQVKVRLITPIPAPIQRIEMTSQHDQFVDDSSPKKIGTVEIACSNKKAQKKKPIKKGTITHKRQANLTQMYYTQQLLFLWNNMPMKQVSIASDTLVNGAVRVLSYVNIVSKSRIMIISQNNESLKFQLNLIDLSLNRVICRNQLGSNFQLHRGDPSKLKVQTMRINERLSCIYLIGGEYVKIFKNTSLVNVKRVHQIGVQSVIPINKLKQLMILSINGMLNIYSIQQANSFKLIKTLRILRPEPGLFFYVKTFDIDASAQHVFFCIQSDGAQYVQMHQICTGQVIFTQELNLLKENPDYSIVSLKVFHNLLYIEIRKDISWEQQPVSYVERKVYSYYIYDDYLKLAKVYNHSNILSSSFSSKQFFLYDAQHLCILGFEKVKSSEQQLDSNVVDHPQTIVSKRFKLQIRQSQSSVSKRPIFTNIIKDTPAHIRDPSESSIHSFETHAHHDEDHMVLTLFDQNKNLYRIYQN